jgi:drug/metabolite transporter (DMT)-like permease
VSAGTVAALAVLVVLWASAFPIIKIGLEELSAPHLTLLRHLVASGAFVVFLVALRRRLWPLWRDWPALSGLGVVGIFVYHLALNTGEMRVSAGGTSLIIATAPLLTAIVATVLGRERLSALGWAGSLLGFVGVALIVLGDAAANGSGALAPMLEPYAGLILLAAFATAVFAVLQRPLLERYRPIEVMAYVTWGGTLPMLLFLPGLGEAVAGAWPRSALAAVTLGIFPSAIAYTLFAAALSRAPATLVTTYLYLIPLVALLLSWWWLGEVPTALTVVGGAVVVVALIVVRRAKRREGARAAALAARSVVG